MAYSQECTSQMVMLMDKVKQGIQMGTVTVQKYTTTSPISLIGEEAGICWGADITDEAKNHKRGIDCIKANHGRALEFP